MPIFSAIRARDFASRYLVPMSAGFSLPAIAMIRSTFSLKSAFKFTLLFLVVLLVSKGASEEFADAGVYVSAFLAGLADVDAISLSIARLHEGGGIGREPALWALAIASATNSLAKVGIAAVLGGARLGLYVGVPIVLALGVGALVLFLL